MEEVIEYKTTHKNQMEEAVVLEKSMREGDSRFTSPIDKPTMCRHILLKRIYKQFPSCIL